MSTEDRKINGVPVRSMTPAMEALHEMLGGVNERAFEVTGKRAILEMVVTTSYGLMLGIKPGETVHLMSSTGTIKIVSRIEVGQ